MGIRSVALLVLFFSQMSFGSDLFPKLFFEHGYVFDQSCQTDSKQPITEAMENELDQRLPDLQKLWEEKGTDLLTATIDITKHDFGRREESVTLILCPWFAPMSQPLMLRVRSYLKSATEKGNKNFYTTLRPDFYFVSQVYHELLHRYLDHNFETMGLINPSRSPLANKYRKENKGVLIHLHLLALQKAVYLKVHRDDDLQKIIQFDSEIPGDIYKRAWEIVNKEGYDKFLDELKSWKK